jgi:hypothetical protein
MATAARWRKNCNDDVMRGCQIIDTGSTAGNKPGSNEDRLTIHTNGYAEARGSNRRFAPEEEVRDFKNIHTHGEYNLLRCIYVGN